MQEDVLNYTPIAFCPLAGCYISWRFDCFQISSIFRHNRACHQNACESEMRVCPACILQGDLSREEYAREIFSLGKIKDEDCPWCSFHRIYGSKARRTDTSLFPLKNCSAREPIPVKQDFIIKDGVRHRIVEQSFVSDFFHEINSELRESRIKWYSPEYIERTKKWKKMLLPIVIALLSEEAKLTEPKKLAPLKCAHKTSDNAPVEEPPKRGRGRPRKN